MKKYKLIIVENDEDERFFMKEAFDKAGLFDILTMTSNGDELFEWLEGNMKNLPDVILSDLNMPGKNGYDIISEMKSNPLYEDIPVIITSTSSTKSIMDKCLANGAAEYMVKPESFIKYGPFIKDLQGRIINKKLVK